MTLEEGCQGEMESHTLKILRGSLPPYLGSLGQAMLCMQEWIIRPHASISHSVLL